MATLKTLLKGKNRIGKRKEIDMKKILSFLVPLATLISGCNLEEIQDQPMNLQDERIFTASFEQNETRTYVENGNLLRWNAGDQISIFEGNTLNRQYKFDGETGDNAGTFSIVSKPFGTGNDLNCHYAVYPYSSGVKITESGVITAALPAEQSYTENSFGLGANTMVAVTENLDDTFLKFKNVGGYLKLQLYGENVTIKSITLNGNNNDKLAGKATITPAYGQSPTVVMGNEATTSIILDCGDGVEIGSTEETATAFWFVVPPTTFKSGFSITITDVNGETFIKETSNEIAIERNVIKPMKAFEIENRKNAIPNNQIWYTTNDGNIAVPYDSNVFDAKIISNIYEDGKGIITFDGDLTKIGNSAFYNSKNLTDITLPNGVKSIEGSAFSGCTSLINITIPDGVTSIESYTFRKCESLKGITIPNNVTSIGVGAFYSCENLQSITIPDGVTQIGTRAFYYCQNLTSVNIPQNITEISHETFYHCDKLASINIPENVTSIGNWAFYYCIGLTEVKIPDNVTSIGSHAFYNCYNITSTNIPSIATEIGDSAFSGCSSITSITIPDKVTKIGNSAFRSCHSLTSLTISEGVTEIGDKAFYNCIGLTSVTIPSTVTSIGDGAFALCTKIKEFRGKFADENGRCLIIDNAIVAYANLSGTEYSIPDGTTSIRNSAFYYCENLRSVTIPDSITEIGTMAFQTCSHLADVYCQCTTPPVISNDTFSYDYANMIIYVPSESLEAYRSTDYWKDLNLIGINNDTEQFPWFNPDQYITYIENKEIIEPNADDWYEYSSYIGCPISTFSKIEMKYEMIDDGSICYLCCRNSARENTSRMYLSTSGLDIYDEDEEEIRRFSYSWESLNLSKSDRMTLAISFKDKMISINGNPLEYKMTSLSSFKSSFFFSYFTSENDEGTWRVRGEGVPEGSKLYYVKIWDDNDNLVYIGSASKALNPITNQEEYCWRSYYNETENYEFAYYPTTHTDYTPYGGGIDHSQP